MSDNIVTPNSPPAPPMTNPTVPTTEGNTPVGRTVLGTSQVASQPANTPGIQSVPLPSNPTTPTTPTPATAPIKPAPANWQQLAKQKIEEVEKFYGKFAGKVGCNPYNYIVKMVNPLKQRLASFASTFDFGQGKTKDQAATELHQSVQSLETKQEYAIHDPVALQADKDRVEAEEADKKAGRTKTIIQ